MKIKTLLSALGMATLALQVFTFSATEAVAKKHKKPADSEMATMTAMVKQELMLDPKKVEGKSKPVHKYVNGYNKRVAKAKLADKESFKKLVEDYKIMHKKVLEELKATPFYQEMIKKEREELLTSNDKNKAVVDEVKGVYFPSAPQVPSVPNDKDKKPEAPAPKS